MPGQWIWFGVAYLLEFIIPTFDFYPWSYGRLIAPLIILGLMWNLPEKPSELFIKANTWAENLLGQKIQEKYAK